MFVPDEYILKQKKPPPIRSRRDEEEINMRIDSNWNQLNLIVGDTGDRKGQTIRMGDKSTENHGLVSGGSAPLLKLDGPKDSYTVEDAAAELWKRENNMLNPNDPAALARLRDRLRTNGLSLNPTQEELTDYTLVLQRDGTDSDVYWSGLTAEFEQFSRTAPDDLEGNLERLASRYVAALDKLERNYEGDALTERKEKLEAVYQTGKSKLVNGYTQRLQDALGVSDADAQTVRDSFDTLLDEKVGAYQGALKQVYQAVRDQGPNGIWLQDHDGYIATQLRDTVNKAAAKTDVRYSLEDLKAAGKVAQLYQFEIDGGWSGGRNEATLALNLAMADMKAETIIGKELVSENMAALLRNSRPQGHAIVLAAADARLANRESDRLSGEPKGAFTSLDRDLFQGIYRAVMDKFGRNGGNGAEAIRAGVAYGKEATAKAAAKNPEVFRWGNPMEQYWKDFYTTPEPREKNDLDRQVEAMLAQMGSPSNWGCSTYQTFVNDWHHFMGAIGGSLDVRG